MKCPECGTTETRKFGYTWRTLKDKNERWKLQKYQCPECGNIFKDFDNAIKVVVIRS